MSAAFTMADLADEFVLQGRFKEALFALDRAEILFALEPPPLDEDGKPEIYWPYRWQGKRDLITHVMHMHAGLDLAHRTNPLTMLANRAVGTGPLA